MTETTDKTYELGKWSLEDLFPGSDTPEMEAAFKDLDDRISKFEDWRDKLTVDMDVEDFMICIEEQEADSRIATRVNQFSDLWFSEDTQNQDAQAFQGKTQNYFASLQNRSLFFSLWWKSLDEEQAKRFLAVSGEYEYWLNRIRDFKPHTLTEAEEKIINIKDVTGPSAIQRLFGSITNRYVFKLEVDGETKELTRGELMSYVKGSDPELRAAAYQELYKVYGADGPILGQMYQTLVQDYKNENIDLRGYASPISARNLGNDIPDDVVNTLLDVSQKNAKVFQKYFKFKAKRLGMDKLRRYDVYAPISDGADKEYGYDEGIKMTLEALRDFEPKFADLAQRVFDEDHIDSGVRAGKRGGAFCSSGDPSVTPYVLVNYNKRATDIATVAHELGHAIHAMLAEHHNAFTFHSSLPLAETASTFAEIVLTDKLLAEEKDESVRQDILISQIDDAYATIMRQIFFALFEREAHDMIANNATVEELSEAYMKNLKTQFGDSMEISEEFRWEWVSIPHIYYYPFYVYAYAFGQLLVFALYQQYQEEGKDFIPRFLEILASGGSKSPIEILDNAGIDVRKPEFWQGGFDFIARMIDDLEKAY